jgi:hypothetical protein
LEKECKHQKVALEQQRGSTSLSLSTTPHSVTFGEHTKHRIREFVKKHVNKTPKQQ